MRMWNLTSGKLAWYHDYRNGGHNDQVRALVSIGDSLLISGADDKKINVT